MGAVQEKENQSSGTITKKGTVIGGSLPPRLRSVLTLTKKKYGANSTHHTSTFRFGCSKLISNTQCFEYEMVQQFENVRMFVWGEMGSGNNIKGLQCTISKIKKGKVEQ